MDLVRSEAFGGAGCANRANARRRLSHDGVPREETIAIKPSHKGKAVARSDSGPTKNRLTKNASKREFVLERLTNDQTPSTHWLTPLQASSNQSTLIGASF
ncbi:hypothetical protein AZI87_00105 [Bdellovibrio bacteriovorus]|uniref:Uncharacterized protein n=1 Tax=Bdellovibrio bacteriovorus TaxID=959 RepID=A0A161PMU8_BDEBC|nr:hypothetical protein AZI87_00105 [Bdellovibrio bacteriovorus]